MSKPFAQQWRSRPDDDRYLSLRDLRDSCQLNHNHSSAILIDPKEINCQPLELENGFDSKALVIYPDSAEASEPLNLTHYSFGQLCRHARAPAEFLRELPSDLAADNLNYRLEHERIGQLKALVQSNGTAVLRAATSPTYGRIWNDSVADALLNRFGDGVTGDFRVPSPDLHGGQITKANTTIFASDRDMFVFLADMAHPIEIANRRNGKPGYMFRGFVAWNSEVGSSTAGIATFLFDSMCCNRTIFGMQGYEELRMRHTSKAPARWIEEVAPVIERYAHDSTKGITDTIKQAQSRIIKPDEFLTAPKRFTRNQAAAIKAAHISDENRPIENLWDAVVGITAYARSIGYQDERFEVERIAGKILALAA